MRLLRFCIAALVLCLTACQKEKEIRVYRVAKELAGNGGSGDPHAGLPSTVAGGGMADASPGDPHAGLTAAQMAGFAAPESPRVSDSAPLGWSKQAPTALRQLSYRVEGSAGTSVDISLVILRGASGGALQNVNRWRGQLGLQPLDEGGLKAAAQVLKIPAGSALAVDIEGLAPGADPAKDGRMVGVIADRSQEGWFFKMRGHPALVAAEKARFLEWVATVKPLEASTLNPAGAVAPTAGSQAAGSLTWRIPSGWVQAPPGASMRYATFTVAAQDGAKGEVAVSHFPGDVGGDLQNVNRWREQVNLPPVDAAGLAPLIGKVSAGPKTIQVIDLTGPQSRLTAGWTRHGANSWFFKFTGPDNLLASEKAKFIAFLESIRFNQPE